jgi:hypothetical protein
VEYILITLSAIAIATFVVYLLANKVFGVRLRMKSLIMCALCALLMSIVLPRIVVSFAGIAGTIAFLAVFAIIFAYFVAYYDDSDELAPPLDAVSTVLASEQQQLQPQMTVNLLPVTDSLSIISTAEKEQAAGDTRQKVDILTEHTLAPPESTDEIAPSSAPTPEPDISEEVTEAIVGLVFGPSTIPVIALESDSEPTNATMDILAAHASEPAATVSSWAEEQKLPHTITAMSELPSERADNPEPESEALLASLELAMDVSLIPDDEDSAEADLVCEQGATIDEQQESLDSTVFDAHTDKSTPDSEALDDLLDFAFLQKECQNFPLALDTFQRALKIHRDSDAAPFLAVEIASLLKNRGAYDEAITFLTVNRGLAALQHNSAMDQEFIYNIAYLRILKNILLHHRCGFLPFPKIPQDVLQEIDAEFREWRNLA